MGLFRKKENPWSRIDGRKIAERIAAYEPRFSEVLKRYGCEHPILGFVHVIQKKGISVSFVPEDESTERAYKAAEKAGELRPLYEEFCRALSEAMV